MRALTWQGKRDVRVETVPDPTHPGADRRDHRGHLDRDLRLRPAPLRGARPVPHPGRRPRPRDRWASSRRSGPEVAHLKRRRPGRRPVQHLLRLLLDVQPRACYAQCETTQVREQRQGRRAVRLHLAVRRGARRPGRVPPGAAGPLRPDQGARRAPDQRFLYLSDILPTAWQAVEYADVPRGGTLAVLGLGPGRPALRADRPPPRRRPRDRRRPRCPSGSPWRARTASRRSTCPRSTTSPQALIELTGGPRRRTA